MKIVLFDDGDNGDDGDDGDDDDDDDDDDDCRMISLLIQDCTETITEVCEQTNTYSHTTVAFKSISFSEFAMPSNRIYIKLT